MTPLELPVSHVTMRLHHSQDGSTFPGYKLTCFAYISCFFCKEQNTLAINRDTWCHLALCLQMILLHLEPTSRVINYNPRGAIDEHYMTLPSVQATRHCFS